MKKILALMLCLVLALTLVACAKDETDKNKDNDTDLPTNNQPNTTPKPNTGTNNNGTANNGTNDAPITSPGNGGGDTGAESRSRMGRNGTDSAMGGSLFDGNADSMATWRQMIDNGRVRDSDGFLWDGENASWT